jgi:hypothetical protein
VGTQAGHFVWIGLEEPNAEELANLQRQFNLHELAIEDALEKHSRPKLETFGDALFIVTYSPVRHEGKLEFIETHIFAGNGYIITCRNGHSILRPGPPALRGAAAAAGTRRRFRAVRPARLRHRELPAGQRSHSWRDRRAGASVLCGSLKEDDIQPPAQPAPRHPAPAPLRGADG